MSAEAEQEVARLPEGTLEQELERVRRAAEDDTRAKEELEAEIELAEEEARLVREAFQEEFGKVFARRDTHPPSE